MKQIDFHFNVKNRTNYTARLIKKVHAMGLSVGVWSEDELMLKLAYNELWSFEDLTLIPHAWAQSEFAPETTIHFSKDLKALGKKDVLILLNETVPENWKEAFEAFDRIVDIVSTNEEELIHSRNRYKAYRDAGVSLKAYDRSQS